MTIHYASLSWQDYHQRVKDGKTPILLPVGAIEQHGLHMGMDVDVLLPTAIAERVASVTSALVAPPISYGYKSQLRSGGGYHMPGTTSLDAQTLILTIRDLCREWARHGVRHIALLNGHYENHMFLVEGIDLALRDIQTQDVDNMKILLLSYWDYIQQDTLERLYPNGFTGWEIEHGGVMETSLMLALHPEKVDLAHMVDHPPANLPPYDVFPPPNGWIPESGTLSSPKEATKEKGEIILDVCVHGITETLQKEFC